MSKFDENYETMDSHQQKEDNILMTNGINGKSDEDRNEDPTNSLTAESKNSFKFSSSPTLETIREEHQKFTTDRNWDQFHTPRNILLALVGEVGELAELFQWKNECDVGLKDWTIAERKALEDELSDVLIYLIRLSDRCRVDLPQVVVNKLKKNELKYPIDKVYGSSQKWTAYQS